MQELYSMIFHEKLFGVPYEGSYQWADINLMVFHV